jgi:excisionase family DNA binding protein
MGADESGRAVVCRDGALPAPQRPVRPGGGRKMVEPLLTPKQAAARLLVSEKAVLDWLRLGKLKGVKAGRHWRNGECKLEAFLVEPEPPCTDAEAST